MSEIEDALSQLYAIEAALEITAPINVGVKKVWDFVPPMSQVISSTPAFCHSWELPSLEIGSAIKREQFNVNIKLCVYDASTERASHIATAFWPKIRDALSQNVKLGLTGWTIGAVSGRLTPFTEGDPTLNTVKTLMGLDLNLTLYHHLSSANAPGSPPS